MVFTFGLLIFMLQGLELVDPLDRLQIGCFIILSLLGCILPCWVDPVWHCLFLSQVVYPEVSNGGVVPLWHQSQLISTKVVLSLPVFFMALNVSFVVCSSFLKHVIIVHSQLFLMSVMSLLLLPVMLPPLQYLVSEIRVSVSRLNLVVQPLFFFR